MKEVDLTAFRKTTTINLSANTATVAMPEDLVVLRFLRIQNGDMLYQKDETFIREFTKDPGATAGKGTVQYYSYQRPGTAYTSSNRNTNILFAPTPSLAHLHCRRQLRGRTVVRGMLHPHSNAALTGKATATDPTRDCA